MAFSAPGESYLAAYAVWEDPSADGLNTRWLRDGMDALDPDGTGRHYIGEADLGAAASRAQRCYAPADWERLRHVRQRRDPSGLFQDYLTP